MRPSLALKPRNEHQALTQHFFWLHPRPCCLRCCKHAVACVSTPHVRWRLSLHAQVLCQEQVIVQKALPPTGKACVPTWHLLANLY